MSEKRKPILLCPGPDSWVAWQQADDGSWTEVESLPGEAKPWDLSAGKNPWVIGLPLRSIQTMAIKIPSGENASALEEVIPLRLEAAGMDIGEEKISLADWAVASSKSDSRVVMVWTVDHGAIDGCPPNRVPALAVPSFLRWKWQAKELVLWCESGRWIAAFSGESCPVHVQPCVGTENIGQLATDLRGQATALLLRGLSPLPERLVFRGNLPPFAKELAEELGMPLLEKPEAPELMPDSSRVVTKEMLAAREAAVEAKKWRIRIVAAAAIWMAVAAYAAYGYLQARKELAAAQEFHAQVTPRAKEMREVQTTLDLITSSTSSEALPLEVLILLTKSMPTTDFRLTNFTVEGDRDVFLKGSAKRADLALRFANDLRRNRDLSTYQWETPPPGQEKDGTASFTYNGKFRTNLQP